MNTEIILREKHNEKIQEEKEQTYKAYTEYYNEALGIFNKLDELLKDVQGKIVLSPDNKSWLSQRVTVEYKNLLFEVGKNYKGKLQVYSKELYKYQSSTIYDKTKLEFIEKNKPLNYTFDKVTSKKLLEVFEYYIKLLELTRVLTEDKEKTNLGIYEEYKKQYIFLANTLKLDINEKQDNNSKWIILYCPFGSVKLEYFFNDKRISTDSYTVEKYLEMIKKIKEGIKK
jgi:hypothetical protein